MKNTLPRWANNNKKDWPVYGKESTVNYSDPNEEALGNGKSKGAPEESATSDGQLKSSEGGDKPEGSRHPSSSSERKTSSRTRGKSSQKGKSGPWSEWIWSQEHSRYYCYRPTSNGDTEYRWDESQIAQEGETSTPKKVDELSITEDAVGEASAAQDDLDTTALPLDPFYGSLDNLGISAKPHSRKAVAEYAVAKQDDLYASAPPLDQCHAYPDNLVTSAKPQRQKASATPYAKTSKFSSGKVDYVVAGTVNDVPTSATPDNGSDTCILSSSFAAKLGVEPIPGTRKTITLANRRQVMSPGMVKVRWTFANESQSHKLSCWIIPGCFSDFILGSQFLQATRTFTSYFKSRVKKIFQPRRLRLGLIGEGKQYLSGYLAPWLTAALADTGSDIMAISLEYAESRSMLIDDGPEGQVPIELPDGKVVWTLGLVHGIPWAIGGRDDAKLECDFYVIENLTEDLILSKHYLFQLDVFSQYSRYFLQSDPASDPSFCGIRLVDDVAWDPEALEREFLVDATSPDAFSPEKVAQELARRDMVRDRIAMLPASEQDKATREEEKRKVQWNEAKKAHRARWARRGGGTSGA